MLMISIDPGINTGWCLWKDGKPIYQSIVVEKENSKKDELPKRVGQLVNTFDNDLNFIAMKMTNSIVCHAVIERSEFWDSSFKSRTSAKSGALQFLSMIIGAYCAYFFKEGIDVKLISPFQWKGQLPDRLIIQRSNNLVNRLSGYPEGKGFVNHNIHLCCAIGIGAHYLGYPEFNHVKAKAKN